jgi:membrane protein YdbS with pleckstrin-like domain
MARRMTWRDGEEQVIVVTPVAKGLLRPVLSLITAVVLVQFGAVHVHFIHVHETLFLLVLAGPCLVLVLTRTWRWRSHKIRVTDERVVVEGGVARHFRSTVELRDVVATRVEQGVAQRLLHRGRVQLETSAGTLDVGLVRYPAALCRVIDAQRARYHAAGVPLDTVFEFEHPDPHDYVINPRSRRDRQWDE